MRLLPVIETHSINKMMHDITASEIAAALAPPHQPSSAREISTDGDCGHNLDELTQPKQPASHPQSRRDAPIMDKKRLLGAGCWAQLELNGSHVLAIGKRRQCVVDRYF